MRRPSPALVLAFLALCIALSGVAWAQSKIPADSVGRIQLREGAVGTKQIRDGSVLKRDLSRGLSTRGPRGARGRRGAPGATRVAVRNRTEGEVAPGAIGQVSVGCADGERVTGGGGGFAGPPTTNDRLVESLPVGDGPSPRWRIAVFNGGERPRTPVAYAMCARP